MKIALVILVALVAIVIFLALRSPAPDAGSDHELDPPVPAREPAAMDDEAPLAPTEGESEARAHSRAIIDDPEDPASAEEETQTTPTGLRVQVVDAEGRPAPSAEGTRLDVGELTLRDVPPLVAGRVEDEAGAPVNQAWLRIRYPLGEEPNERWFHLSSRYQGRIGTDAAGCFEVRLLKNVRALRLRASRTGKGSSKEIEVPPGTPDVRLVLEPDEDFTKTRGRHAVRKGERGAVRRPGGGEVTHR